MICPKCASCDLMIRQDEGREHIMVWLTGKRKYYCTICEYSFRARELRRPLPVKTGPATKARKSAAKG